jgi:hypothetical protein
MGRSPVEARQTVRSQPSAPGAFSAPSSRPDEPITAGAPFGEGQGPMAAGIPMMASGQNNVIEELKSIFQRFPNDDLADLLDSFIREGY